MDYTIFATIIAEHFRKILPVIIHLDQNRFLPKRSLQSNLRTILNVLEYYEKHSDKQLALIFLDVEKAFDNISRTVRIYGIRSPYCTKFIFLSRPQYLLTMSELTTYKSIRALTKVAHYPRLVYTFP